MFLEFSVGGNPHEIETGIAKLLRVAQVFKFGF